MKRFFKTIFYITGGAILWRVQYHFFRNDYYTALSLLNGYFLGLVLYCYAETIGSEIKYKKIIFSGVLIVLFLFQILIEGRWA